MSPCIFSFFDYWPRAIIADFKILGQFDGTAYQNLELATGQGILPENEIV